MRKRIKKVKTIVYLIVVIMLLYIQQSVVSYAGEVTIPDASSGESNLEEGGNGESSSEGGSSESGSSENDFSENGSSENEPSEELPEVKKFTLHISKEDGKNGYFVTKPKVFIEHISEAGVTKYQVIHGETIKISGKLSDPTSSVVFSEDIWSEGKSVLKIWMENEEGEVIEGMEEQKEILVDTIAPEVRMELPNGFANWYKAGTTLSVSAEDKGSDVDSIFCIVENEKIGEANKKLVDFSIQKASNRGSGVEVVVGVTDFAGNVTEKKEQVYIDNTPPLTLIRGAQEYLITSQPLQLSYLAEEDNVLQEVYANVVWENIEGKKKTVEVKTWEKGMLQAKGTQTLSEDGIYEIYFAATDKAGYKSEKKMQVIIDKANPIIKFLDELDQRYLQQFSWEYDKEEFIQDFTTYTYEIRLDGKLYHLGTKVEREGKHIIEIKATDAAGNEAKAKAEFFVDRTKPEVLFLDVKNGETYEKEKTFKVALRNIEDTIEEIRINGDVQKISENGKSYQYTVNEAQDYKIVVTACDKAGNRSEKTLFFTVNPEKTMLQKVAGPIKETISQMIENPKTKEKGEEKEKEKTWNWMLAILLFAGVIGIIGWGYWRKDKKKES
ncbi:MAG: hypothetical protein ACI4UH_06670 [Dorea sp.]